MTPEMLMLIGDVHQWWEETNISKQVANRAIRGIKNGDNSHYYKALEKIQKRIHYDK